MKLTVGVLALQGGFASHIAVLKSLSAPEREIDAREVRTAVDLEPCDALVIPGGESTVLTKHLMKSDTGPAFGTPWEPAPLWHAIRAFAAPGTCGTEGKPVMGTCAGLIMLCGPCDDERVYPFSLLPVTVERNGWGRQTESFIEPIALPREITDSRTDRTAAWYGETEIIRQPGLTETSPAPYRAVFIRAPRIRQVDPEVQVIASLSPRAAPDTLKAAAEPVLVRYKNILALTFHPELTPEDPRIHQYFLGMLE